MPNHFQLTSKQDTENGPLPLQQIDEMICAIFDVPVHPKKWCLNWYNNIGLGIAVHGLARTVEIAQGCYDELEAPDEYDRQELDLAHWLLENFDDRVWYQPR